jgi:hypothetical protein
MKYVCIILAFCYATSATAQDTLTVTKLTQYLFPTFTEGTILYKSGARNKGTLNYNTLTQEIVFDDNGQQMALANPKDVDTVFLQNIKLIPVDDAFYEVATTTPVALFIQHQTQVIPPGSNTGFGTTQTSATSSISDLKSSGKAYALKLPDDFKLIPQTTYWLKQNNKYTIVRSVKDIKKIFASKAAAIDDYVKANKISFKNNSDVVKLVEFCNQP